MLVRTVILLLLKTMASRINVALPNEIVGPFVIANRLANIIHVHKRRSSDIISSHKPLGAGIVTTLLLRMRIITNTPVGENPAGYLYAS